MPDTTGQLLLSDAKETQAERLLRHFQAGGTVTSLEAYTTFKITQLARVIDDLQKQGHRFDKPRTRLPSGKIVVRYSLIREGIKNEHQTKQTNY